MDRCGQKPPLGRQRSTSHLPDEWVTNRSVLVAQVVLNCSALPCLLHLLSSAKESIRKEACWTISNITAGNRGQIQVMQPELARV